jgi:hypothetical protein
MFTYKPLILRDTSENEMCLGRSSQVAEIKHTHTHTHIHHELEKKRLRKRPNIFKSEHFILSDILEKRCYNLPM